MSLNYVRNISLDVNACAGATAIKAKQGDASSRFLNITILKDGAKYSPEDNVVAMCRCEKPDGHAALPSATINQDGTITVELSSQTLAVAGRVRADLALMAGNEVLSSVVFYIDVEKSPNVSNQVASSNDFKWLSEFNRDAEAWAIGKRAGVPVPSDDSTYHNNSKYYSELATLAASNISDYAESAASSAEAAENSATAAANSASSASESSASASGSATAAALSAEEAAGAALETSGYVSSVSSDAAAAASSATSAALSAEGAATSASSALSSANSASDSAAAAVGSASSASLSAEGAATSANAASEYAASASNSATAAAGSASDASDSATSASNSASDAASAKNDAVTAQHAAESARDEAIGATSALIGDIATVSGKKLIIFSRSNSNGS